MRPTKFSGPLLYSGQVTNSGSFTDMPIGFNPDYVQIMDDFTGLAVDTTNDFNFAAATGGTVSSYDADTSTAQPDSNFSNGWAVVQSDPTDPAAVASGGSFQTTEQFNMLSGRMPLLLESRVGLTNPKNCDFFFGATEAPNIATPNTGYRVGFGISASSGTGELQIVVKNSTSEVVTDTGYIMPAMCTASSGLVDTIPQGSNTRRNTAPVLSMRQVNVADHPNLFDTGQCRAYFYVDRTLIGTISQQSYNEPWPNFHSANSVLYRKASELGNTITLATEMPANTDNINIQINGVETTSTSGSGLWTSQILTIGTEDVEILRDFPAWGASGGFTGAYYTVKRGVNGTTAAEHLVGAEFTSATAGCLMDYISTTKQRFPSSPQFGWNMTNPDMKGSG